MNSEDKRNSKTLQLEGEARRNNEVVTLSTLPVAPPLGTGEVGHVPTFPDLATPSTRGATRRVFGAQSQKTQAPRRTGSKDYSEGSVFLLHRSPRRQ